MKKTVIFFSLMVSSLLVNLVAQAQYGKPSCLATGSVGAYMCPVQKNQQNCLIMKGAGYSCDWGLQRYSCVALIGGNGSICAYQKDFKNCQIVAQRFNCAWLSTVIPYYN